MGAETDVSGGDRQLAGPKVAQLGKVTGNAVDDVPAGCTGSTDGDARLPLRRASMAVAIAMMMDRERERKEGSALGPSWSIEHSTPLSPSPRAVVLLCVTSVTFRVQDLYEYVGPAGNMESVVALLRACITLLAELVFGRLPLDGARLSLRTKGIDRSLLNSLKGRDLKAFVDGSVLEDGSCGCGIYYRDGHYLNFSGGFAAESASSNLAELAALFFALLRHPKGQHLSIFSDSAFALHVVQSVSTEAESDLSTSAAARKRNRRTGRVNANTCPKLDSREQAVAHCVWWLLRLRTAQTVFYKVPAHKGFTQNHSADSLARQGAEAGPVHELPRSASPWALFLLLMRYLLGQSKLDGGTMDTSSFIQTNEAECAAAAAARRRAMVPRPGSTGTSTELTRVLALDCEMVGIGAFGHESRLASVSVCNDQGNSVYFSYAKPPRPVTDYRTKYSGIEPKHLADAPTAAQVQKEVKELVSGHVIVGHSLEVCE